MSASETGANAERDAALVALGAVPVVVLVEVRVASARALYAAKDLSLVSLALMENTMPLAQCLPWRQNIQMGEVSAIWMVQTGNWVAPEATAW